MDAKMKDRRIVKESKLRTFIRSNGRSPLTWIFSIILTQVITGKAEYTFLINIPIIIFAVVLGWVWERRWLRIRWGIENEQP